MKIVIATDSFKGSLSSLEAGQALKKGIIKAIPEATVKVCPIADGGEGTVEALSIGMGGRIKTIEVKGPLGNIVRAKYGIVEETKLAIIEMAQAAGITLISEEERNPLLTTTYGVGEIIRDAIQEGCRRFIVGIGGSATNDAGVGMLKALGYEFIDSQGHEVGFGAKELEKIDRIVKDNVLSELNECTFRIACDVKNPLCGENGCSYVFAPQKGATPEMVEYLDKILSEYALKVKNSNSECNPDFPGAGAAGGLGFAFHTFLNSELESGIEIVLSETELEAELIDSDLVITGEGKLDGQSIMGKAPIGVAKLAKKYGKHVIAVAGCLGEDVEDVIGAGIDEYYQIGDMESSVEDSMNPDNAKKNLEKKIYDIINLLMQ